MRLDKTHTDLSDSLRRMGCDLPFLPGLPDSYTFTRASLQAFLRHSFNDAAHRISVAEGRKKEALAETLLYRGNVLQRLLETQMQLHARSAVITTSFRAWLPHMASNRSHSEREAAPRRRSADGPSASLPVAGTDGGRSRQWWEDDELEPDSALSPQNAERVRRLRAGPDADSLAATRRTISDFFALAHAASQSPATSSSADASSSPQSPARPASDPVAEARRLSRGTEVSRQPTMARLRVHSVAKPMEDEDYQSYFHYQINFENVGDVAVQILGRHFVIEGSEKSGLSVGSAAKPEAGILGEQPVLLPGERLCYVSYAWARSRDASMRGGYYCRAVSDEMAYRLRNAIASTMKTPGQQSVPLGDPTTHFTADLGPMRVIAAARGRPSGPWRSEAIGDNVSTQQLSSSSAAAAAAAAAADHGEDESTSEDEEDAAADSGSDDEDNDEDEQSTTAQLRWGSWRAQVARHGPPAVRWAPEARRRGSDADDVDAAYYHDCGAMHPAAFRYLDDDDSSDDDDDDSSSSNNSSVEEITIKVGNSNSPSTSKRSLDQVFRLLQEGERLVEKLKAEFKQIDADLQQWRAQMTRLLDALKRGEQHGAGSASASQRRTEIEGALEAMNQIAVEARRKSARLRGGGAAGDGRGDAPGARGKSDLEAAFEEVVGEPCGRGYVKTVEFTVKEPGMPELIVVTAAEQGSDDEDE